MLDILILFPNKITQPNYSTLARGVGKEGSFNMNVVSDRKNNNHIENNIKYVYTEKYY